MLVKRRPEKWTRILLGLIATAVLVLVYFLQRASLVEWIGVKAHPYTAFVINRTIRLIANDAACMVLIYALFLEKKYLKVAFWVFLVELFILLPLYLIVKLTQEGVSEISSPLLSQVHRLIVNPMLMILLIGGFFYQRLQSRQQLP